MGKNEPAVASFLQRQGLGDILIIDIGSFPQSHRVTLLFTITRGKCAGAEVTGKGVEAIRFRNVERLLLPVSVHLLHRDAGILRQNLVDVCPREPMARNGQFSNRK